MLLTTPPSDKRRRVATHPPLRVSPNGDEEAYPLPDGRPSRIAVFSKGLEHDESGAVVPEAYGSLRRALATRRTDHFDEIRMGPGGRRLGAPWAGLAAESSGPGPSELVVPDPPRLDSAEEAADLVELLWLALLRDVPFALHGQEPLAAAALDDLARLSAGRVFGRAGAQDARALFRGLAAEDASGPVVSQLLLHVAAPGSSPTLRRRRTAAPGVDHGTEWAAFLALQNGDDRRGAMAWDPTCRLPRSPRDLATLARDDVPPQAAFLDAAILLLARGAEPADGVPTDAGSERRGATGAPDSRLLDLIGQAAGRALRAAWWQKWYVHRRSRPEAVSGLLQRALTTGGGRRGALPVHPELLTSEAPRAVRERHGSALLPLAWPEGAPLHPSYVSAHAAVAAACATVLRAWFREDAVWERPLEPSADGSSLLPYDGPPTTVGAEIGKLATNVAMGRLAAGVSRRSDVHAGLRLGEQVAEAVLGSRRADDVGERTFTFTRLDGTVATVVPSADEAPTRRD